MLQFSIIIPAKNEEATIGRCLDSLANVDWDRSQFEVIVVDNGSTDRTADIAKGKGAHLFIKPELSIAALRNYGVTMANGAILVFLDADCTVAVNWLRSAARYLSRDDVICFGSPPVIPENATWVQIAWFQVRRRSERCVEVDWLESMNMFVRRDGFISVSGFNEKMVTCEDYDLSLRLRSLGKLVSDERIVAVHHGEAASVSHFFRKEYWRGTSNLSGIFHHGITLKELPSVLFPSVYCILGVVTISVLIAGFLNNNLAMNGGILLLLAWQTPIFLLAIWKSRSAFRLIHSLQLYLLINFYFLARGLALIQWH